MLTLVFSKNEKIENAVIKFFQAKFFDQNQEIKPLSAKFSSHLKNASVSDLVCIEKIVTKIRKEDEKFLFEFWSRFVTDFIREPSRLKLYVIRIIGYQSWIEN